MEHNCEEHLDLDGSYDFEGDEVLFYGYCKMCTKRLIKSYREKQAVMLDESL